MKTHVAIIGCGKRQTGKEGWAIGHSHARGWLAVSPDVVLSAVDPSPENLKTFAETFGIPNERCFSSTRELYAKGTPDAVSLCTWPKLHGPQCLEAVDAGVKGILCEKPLATDPQTIRAMDEACRQKGVSLSAAHQRRYDPWFETARDLIRSGAIGSDLVLEARVGDGWDILSWTVHWFDMAHFLLDAKPSSVLAGMDVTGAVRYDHAVENGSVIFVEYDGGAQGIFVTGPDQKGAAITVRGDKGFLEIEASKHLRLWTDAGCKTFHPEATPRTMGFPSLMADLLAQMAGGPAERCDVTEAAIATELAFAAQESARCGRRISLPLSLGYAPLEVKRRPLEPRAFPFRSALAIVDGHFGSGGPEGLLRTLETLTASPVRRVEAKAGLAEKDLAGVDLIAIFHTEEKVDEGTKSLLSKWVEEGKPLFVAHGGLGAWRHWGEFHAWCGRVWDWDRSIHPHEESTLVPRAGSADFPWARGWLPKDEIFMDLKDVSPVIDLMDVHMSKGPVPGAWIHRERRNVRVWVPGHRGDLWDLEPMVSGIRALWNGRHGAVGPFPPMG